MTDIEGSYSEYRQVLWNRQGDQTPQNSAIGSGYNIRHIPLRRRFYLDKSISLAEPPYTLQEYENPDTEERLQYCSKVFNPSGYSVETWIVHEGEEMSDFLFTRHRVIGPGIIEHLTIRPNGIQDNSDESEEDRDISPDETGVLLYGEDRPLSNFDPVLDYSVTVNLQESFSLLSIPLSYADCNRIIAFPACGRVMEVQDKRIVGKNVAADKERFVYMIGEWFPIGPYTLCCDPKGDKFHFKEIPSLSFPSITIHIPPLHRNGHPEELDEIVLRNPIKRPDMTEKFFKRWNAKIELSSY